MAARPSWEGHLRLSLVTCPVALYPATSEAETVRFNMINPATGNRIKMKTVDAGTGEEVSRGSGAPIERRRARLAGLARGRSDPHALHSGGRYRPALGSRERPAEV